MPSRSKRVYFRVIEKRSTFVVLRHLPTAGQREIPYDMIVRKLAVISAIQATGDVVFQVTAERDTF